MSTGSNLSPDAKSKTASVLLAVFLGPWTWLYTYGRDKAKFWVGMLPTIGIPVLWVLTWTVFASSLAGSYDCGVNAMYSGAYSDCAPVATAATAGFSLGVILWPLTMFSFPAIWLWSVIDAAVKRDSFYSNYPNG